MDVARAMAQILRREGVEYLIGYPQHHVIETAAEADIRTIMVRQERVGIHMADAVSRVTSGQQIGVFAMQYGPGSENAFGGVAQAYANSVPIVLLPGGFPRAESTIRGNFSALLNYGLITKHLEQINRAEDLAPAMRRAFSQVRNGRPRPVALEVPWDVYELEAPDPSSYRPAPVGRPGPDPTAVHEVAAALAAAERPVIYAGQGIHYAQAWPQLRELAELLGAPVTTSIAGKSAFPETHPLSLGSGGRAYPKAVRDALDDADLVFGIGCSFGVTAYGIRFRKGPRYIQATLDPADLSQEVEIEAALVGDAALTLDAVLADLRDRLRGQADARAERAARTAERVAASRAAWLATWEPKLSSSTTPFSPYRVIRDLLATVDVENTIITHDAGSPRDQLSPFWRPVAPLTYLGWGKSTQLGYGLGLALGAKLARPDRLCINVMGDAAIGMVGMDFETAVRERLPIITVLLNNFSMAIELNAMPVATEKYRSTDISGNYADMATAFGGHGERVSDPAEIVPAIKRAIRSTLDGTPALLEFLTTKEQSFSTW